MGNAFVTKSVAGLWRFGEITSRDLPVFQLRRLIFRARSGCVAFEKHNACEKDRKTDKTADDVLKANARA